MQLIQPSLVSVYLFLVHGSGRLGFDLVDNNLNLKRPSSDVLTLYGEAMFIARFLRCLFLDECRQGSSLF